MNTSNKFYYQLCKVLDSFNIPYNQVRNMVLFRFYFSRKLTKSEYVAIRNAIAPFVRFIEFGDSFCSEYSKMVTFCEVLFKNPLID